MKTRLGILALTVALAALIALPVGAEEFHSFSKWAAVYGPGDLGDTPPITAFGDVMGSWVPNIQGGSLLAMAYDSAENGLWVASESGGGAIYLFDAGAGHAILRTISILAFGLTGDGNSDGIALDMANNRILVGDFQGDLNISDDIIYDIDYTTGALNQYWILDGAGNTSTDGAFINTVLGVCVDGDGGVWASDNESLIHSINLLPDGTWNQNFQQSVPGGGSWGGLDWDPCLGEFFTANFALQRAQYHDLLTNNPLQQFGAMNTSTGVTSNENGLLYVGGFGDGTIWEHEGIPCNTTATQESSFGNIKALYN